MKYSPSFTLKLLIAFCTLHFQFSLFETASQEIVHETPTKRILTSFYRQNRSGHDLLLNLRMSSNHISFQVFVKTYYRRAVLLVFHSSIASYDLKCISVRTLDFLSDNHWITSFQVSKSQALKKNKQR